LDLKTKLDSFSQPYTDLESKVAALRKQNSYFRSVAHNALDPYFKRVANGKSDDLLDSSHTPQAEYEDLNKMATADFDNYSPGGGLNGINPQFEEWEAEKYVPELKVWRDFLVKVTPSLSEIEERGKNILDQKNALDGQLNEIKHNAEAEAAQKLQASELRITAAKAKLETFPAIEDYLSDFSPTPFQKTLTDADGKYFFAYPRSKTFMIFATATRSTANGTEKYWWLVNTPGNVESGQLFLSNNNLTGLVSLEELSLW
jgi:hypothetical protein